MNINEYKRTSFPFEEFLKEIYAENYMGTDYDMPQAFDYWSINLNQEELIAYANKMGNELIKLL